MCNEVNTGGEEGCDGGPNPIKTRGIQDVASHVEMSFQAAEAWYDDICACIFVPHFFEREVPNTRDGYLRHFLHLLSLTRRRLRLQMMETQPLKILVFDAYKMLADYKTFILGSNPRTPVSAIEFFLVFCCKKTIM